MSYKILLVDDSNSQLEVLNKMFCHSGFEVETATNGAEAYQKIFSFAPDVILSDIIMPNLDGYQLCRLIKNNPTTNKIPVILFTVLDKKIDKFWGQKAGAEKFLSKTMEFDEILNATLDVIQAHPVPEEKKAELLSQSVNSDTVQNQINNILDELLMHSTFLNEFRDLGEYLTHEKVLIERTFALLSSFVDYNIAGIFFNNSDAREKKVLYLHVCKNPLSNFVIEKIKRDFFTQIANINQFSLTEHGHEIVKNDLDEDCEKIISAEQMQSNLILPVKFQNKLLGGICFYNLEKFDYSKFKFYNVMIAELSALFKMKYLYSEIEYLSVTDGLTGLYNRRHFELNINREFLRYKRYPGDLSLAIMDLDFFKKINDTYGHQFGDYILKEVSSLLKQSFRKTDMIYRYGGEELTIILPGTSMENAVIPMERFRRCIEDHIFHYNDTQIKITISIGISSMLDVFSNEKDLVESADKALYNAKQTGRNKVVVYTYDEFAAESGK